MNLSNDDRWIRKVLQDLGHHDGIEAFIVKTDGRSKIEFDARNTGHACDLES